MIPACFVELRLARPAAGTCTVISNGHLRPADAAENCTLLPLILRPHLGGVVRTFFMAPEARIVISAAVELYGDDVLVRPVVDAACLLIDRFPVNLHGILPVCGGARSCACTDPDECPALGFVPTLRLSMPALRGRSGPVKERSRLPAVFIVYRSFNFARQPAPARTANIGKASGNQPTCIDGRLWRRMPPPGSSPTQAPDEKPPWLGVQGQRTPAR